eukprot:XP_001697617.1 predicted protein [Chlamydomonas reinhardtii]
MLRGSILSAQSTGAFSCGAAAVMPSLRSANSLHGSFAASAAFSSPISTTTSCLDVSQNQERGLSTEATGEGESEDDPTYLRGIKTQSGLRNSDGDEEPPDRRIRMMPRPAGWGLRCPDLLYELCGLVGLRDVSIRVRGQRGSRFFVAQCFQEALQKQTTPHDGVEATGMYIREVFRGGPGGRLPCGLRRGVDVM